MNQPRRILVLFFHPRFENSRANRSILRQLQSGLQVTVRDMYELYPDFDIDVKQEQAQLLAHDVILWMHPFYWYSCPPLMKQWIDLVLEHGWAYGPGGNHLAGKWMTNVLTAGGDFDAYRKQGRNRFTFRELLSPFEQTVHLCQMHYLPPFVVPAAPRRSSEELDQYAAQLVQMIETLQQPQLPLDAFTPFDYFNDINTAAWSEQYFKTP